MVENVLLASELVKGFNRKRVSRRGLLKVDLRKAFDIVNWEFVITALSTADFPPKFFNWIKQCLTTISFSISINRDLCGNFHGKIGLQQGDPLSPSLFVIAMEVFGDLLYSKFDNGQIGMHPKVINPRISHLAIADDVFVIFNGKKESLKGINRVLDEFHDLSGLQMNTLKKSLYTAGLTRLEAASVSGFGFQIGSLPVRYLGLPQLHRKLRISEYFPLIESISVRFNIWAVKILPFAGRLQLISSVIYPKSS